MDYLWGPMTRLSNEVYLWDEEEHEANDRYAVKKGDMQNGIVVLV